MDFFDRMPLKKWQRLFLVTTGAMLLSTPASASELVFQFTNPSFGGNPFNSSHLLGIANAQNDYTDPDAVDRSDPAAQFLRTLQSRLLSSLATQITDIIFGDDAQNSGLIKAHTDRAPAQRRVRLIIGLHVGQHLVRPDIKRAEHHALVRGRIQNTGIKCA